MIDLIEVYNNMALEADEVQKEAEANQEEESVVGERMEVIAKYAELSDNLLAEEYGEGNYEEQDVTKLAEMLIVHDQEVEEAQIKVAEYAQAGQIMAHAFKAELDNLAADAQE